MFYNLGTGRRCFAGSDRCSLLELAHDRRQRAHELVAAFCRQRIECAPVNALGQWPNRAQYTAALLSQLHRIRAGILLGAPALQQSLFLQAAHDVGQRRTVDAGAVDDAGLAEAFVLRNRREDGELARSKAFNIEPPTRRRPPPPAMLDARDGWASE